MAQVYGAGGKTVPKPGRLGTGSYHPEGTPLFISRGNTFPGIVVTRIDHPQTEFGRDMSRASIATRGPTRDTKPISPLHNFYNTATLPLAPATVPSSQADQNNLQPISPATDNLQMPHERNTNSASGTKKKPQVYRTVFGGSRTMPTDTAFQNDPNAMYKHTVRPTPPPAVEAVKKSASVRTFGVHQNTSASVSGFKTGMTRTPPASFVTHGNLWSDPHMSLISGVKNGVNGIQGQGRWNVVKTGVISVATTPTSRGGIRA